jgi:excisionase family DNA binding protein
MTPTPGTVRARWRQQPRATSGDQGRPADAESGAPGLLTLPAVAARCACSVWTVRGWVDAGKLAVVRLPGRLVRVRASELAAFLERCS